ncbi:hypothetical protein AEM51_01455 [Bacteroidetes bacterium UKL13-3]|jgi:hypothetical protein|nr:hypothetical protein AEM51_01455 [Bacteroidetes bacterium UKL13-3]HCP93458.1 hypothetical protein [Bacteroidota bacterium]
MKLVLDIDDSKGQTLIDFLKSLDFVKIEESYEIPQWHQQLINERLNFFEEFSEQKIKLNEVIDRIESQL